MRRLFPACVLVAVLVMATYAGAQESRPASRKAVDEPKLGPVVQWLLHAVDGAERLAGMFTRTAPMVAAGSREIHVFSSTPVPQNKREWRVDVAAVAGKIVPAKHAASLNKVVVHWVDAKTGIVTSATLDVAALDGFRKGIFSVRQLLELVEVDKVLTHVRQIKGRGDALADASATRIEFHIALHAAILDVMRQVVADEKLVKALSLKQGDVTPTATSVPASLPASKPAVKTVELAGLTYIISPRERGEAGVDVKLAEKPKPSVEGAFALRDALMKQGICVAPVSASKGRMKIVALCLLKDMTGKIRHITRSRLQPAPAPAPDPDDDTPLPPID